MVDSNGSGHYEPGPSKPHPFGQGPHPVFVPDGFCFPDGSKGPISTGQPSGEVSGSPAVDSVMGRIVTMEHP